MNKSKESKPFKSIFRILPYIILLIYLIAVLLLFLAELKQFGLEKHFRATDQVLILLALLIVPFVVYGLSTFIRTLRLKISGQELEIVLDDFKEHVDHKIVNLETNIIGTISTAEQAFWPLLASYDINQDNRHKQKKLIIGAKQDISQIFFVNLFIGIINKCLPENVECVLRIPNGGSLKNFADTRFGWIDIYMDYTGTCCQYFNINHRNKKDDDIIKELNNYGSALGMKWLKPIGASEDYCLVMNKQNAEDYGIRSIRDLKTKGPNLVFTADPEFINRDDCYVGMRKYGISFKDLIPCEINNRYEHMDSKRADVFVGYETDPELAKSNVISLEDPDEFFPRYIAIPVVNQKALDNIEGLENALNKLENIINTEELIQTVNTLNYNKMISVRDLVNSFLNKL